MIGEHIVQATKSGASVCLQADSLDSTLHFTLRKTLNGDYFVSNLVKDQAEHCAERSTLP